LKYILFAIGIILTLIIVWRDICTYLGGNFHPVEGHMRREKGIKNRRLSLF